MLRNFKFTAMLEREVCTARENRSAFLTRQVCIKSLMWNNSNSVVNFRARFSQINLNANFIICRELNLKKLKRTRIYMWSLRWMFFFYIWNFCILSEEILSLRIMETIFWIYIISDVRLLALHSIWFSLLQTMSIPRSLVLNYLQIGAKL